MDGDTDRDVGQSGADSRDRGHTVDLVDTARDLLDAKDPGEVLKRIAHRIRVALTRNTAGVYVLDPSIDGMRAAVTEGLFAKELEDEIVTFGRGILGSIAQAGKAEIINDTAADTRGIEVSGTPVTEEKEKLMAMPLLSGGTCIGVMAVWRGPDEPEFVPSDLEYLGAIGQLAVIALENARGYEESRRRIERLSSLAAIGRELAEAHDQESLLEKVHLEVGRVFDTTNFFVVTWHEGETEYEFAFHTEHGQRMPSLRRDASKGLTGYVLKTRKPLLIRNPEEKRAFLEETGVVSYGESLKSWMGVPLLAGDELMGVMVVQSYETPGLYDSSDLEFFSLIGTEVAVAMQNARLFDSLRAARNEAEEANRAKSTFLARMSHELRTPLNAIINFAYLLGIGAEGDLASGQADLVSRVEDAGRHLLGLINDVLDLAKIESGRMELDLENVGLREIANDAMSTARALAADKPVELRLECPDPDPVVRADRTRIRQVLLNLLSNAIKFTPGGTVKIRVSAPQGENLASVSVTDTGPGIAEDDLEKVFQEFVQVGPAHAGTGLGLPISRKFVEMHGGKMTATSRIGEGSTFAFTLPLAATGRAGSAAAGTPRVATVLVVADDGRSADFIAGCLPPERYGTVVIRDARRALQETLSTMPDLVLIDVSTASNDGWTALGALKGDERTRRVPVVICAVEGERGHALLLHADGCVSKPYDPRALRETVTRFAGRGGTALAIDDDPDSLEIARRVLFRAGLRTLTASGGAEGLALARSSRPDVVVLDLMMPEPDGFEVLAAIRADPVIFAMPVVVVTAKDLTPEEKRDLSRKANALLLKGKFAPEDLERAVARLIPNRD